MCKDFQSRRGAVPAIKTFPVMPRDCRMTAVSFPSQIRRIIPDNKTGKMSARMRLRLHAATHASPSRSARHAPVASVTRWTLGALFSVRVETAHVLFSESLVHVNGYSVVPCDQNESSWVRRCWSYYSLDFLG